MRGGSNERTHTRQTNLPNQQAVHGLVCVGYDDHIDHCSVDRPYAAIVIDADSGEVLY